MDDNTRKKIEDKANEYAEGACANRQDLIPYAKQDFYLGAEFGFSLSQSEAEAEIKTKGLPGIKERAESCLPEDRQAFIRGAEFGYSLLESDLRASRAERDLLRGALDEMLHVFDRDQHNNETEFAEFSAIRRAKEALSTAKDEHYP